MAEMRFDKISTSTALLVCLLCCVGTYSQDFSNSLYGRSNFPEFKPVRCNSSNLRVIPTKHGDVRGKRVDINTGSKALCPVIQFLGIPYAKPPTNERRWKKPSNPNFRSGVSNALTMGPVCPQNLKGKLPEALLPVWHDDARKFIKDMSDTMSEDCLYLNIYVPMELYANETRAPTTYTTRLPVMVYIHGHTFMEGSGNFYDGSVLASYGKVIVVTINYRLGVLGFLSTLDKNCPGNFGLWDQIKALEWISANIGAFGGDPRRVTLFGSGAGAASISLLMVTVQVDSTFQRVILQSGTALSSWTIVKEPTSQTRLFTQHPDIRCSNRSTEEMMTCLRSKRWTHLINADVQPQMYTLAFGPVVDGELLKDMPEKLLSAGEFINYPMILGVSQGDGYGFIRDRGPASLSANEVTKQTYQKRDFQLDVVSFVDGFYRDVGEGKGILRRIIEYMYTDWKSEPTERTLRRSLLDLYTDKQWLEPAVRTAAMSLECAYTVYFYTLFHRPGKRRNVPDWVDAGHGDELPFVFGYPYHSYSDDALFPLNFTKVDRMVSAGIMTYWTNFAKEGDPMKGSEQKTEFISGYPNMFQNIEWPMYDKSEQRSLEISISPTIRDHHRSNKVAFWKSFLPDLLTETGRYLPFIGKSTTLSPQIAAPILPMRTTKRAPWTPKKGLSTVSPDSTDSSVNADAGPLSLQLTITLAIGFVLLFVNIIAFSVVSYHKEKDKFKIEKLQAQLEEKKRFFDDELRKLGVPNNTGDGGHICRTDIPADASRVLEKTDNGATYTCSSSCTDTKSPIRVLPIAALPQLKSCTFRDDSLTSTSAEDQSRPPRRNTFRKFGAYQSSVNGSPASMLACNSREELSGAPHVFGRKSDYSTLGNSARYSTQTTSITCDHKYKTYNGRQAVSGTVKLAVADHGNDVTNRPTSLWPVVSLVASGGGTRQKHSVDNTTSRKEATQNKNPSLSVIPQGTHVFAIHSDTNNDDDTDTNDTQGAEGGYLARDLSCGSKSALLASPDEKPRFRSDTSESETDRTGSLSRCDGVGSYCVTNNKTMNIITKL